MPESHSKGEDPLSKSAVTYTFRNPTKSRFSRKRALALLFFLPQNTHQSPQPLAVLILMGQMVKRETSHHFKRGHCQNTRSPQGLLTFSTTLTHRLLKLHELLLGQNPHHPYTQAHCNTQRLDKRLKASSIEDLTTFKRRGLCFISITKIFGLSNKEMGAISG